MAQHMGDGGSSIFIDQTAEYTSTTLSVDDFQLENEHMRLIGILVFFIHLNSIVIPEKPQTYGSLIH